MTMLLLLTQEQSTYKVLDQLRSVMDSGTIGMESVYTSAVEHSAARELAIGTLGSDYSDRSDSELIEALEGIYEDITGSISRLFKKNRVVDVDDLAKDAITWGIEHLNGKGLRGAHVLADEGTRFQAGDFTALYQQTPNRLLTVTELHKAANADSSMYTQLLVKHAQSLREVNRVLVDVDRLIKRQAKAPLETLGVQLAPYMAKLRQSSLLPVYAKSKYTWLGWGATPLVVEGAFSIDPRIDLLSVKPAELDALSTASQLGQFSRSFFQFLAITQMAEEAIEFVHGLDEETYPLTDVYGTALQNEMDWEVLSSDWVHDHITGLWYLIAKRASCMAGAMAHYVRSSVSLG